MRTLHRHHDRRSIALRYRIGLALAFLLAAVLAAGTAQADGISDVFDNAPPPLTTLVKFDDREFEVRYSDAVSLEPLSTASVRKIGYGYERVINIANTSTGTYSTDGMVSPHVQYPGVNVEEIFKPRYRPILYPWHASSGPGFSIFSIGRSPLGKTVINHINQLGVRSCMGSGSIISCYRTY